MGEKKQIGEVITEMMGCLDTAVDRLHDAAELMDLTNDERKTLKKHGMALETVIKNLKQYFRSSESLDSAVQQELESYLR